MSRDNRLLRTLHVQGQVCAGLGSPMYGDVLDRMAADVEAGGVFAVILSGHENDPGRLATPLRPLGRLHRLVLDGRAPMLRRWYPSTAGHWDAEAAWPDIAVAAAEHTDQLRTTLDQPPQTNEVGRSAALIGGLLILARRFGLPISRRPVGPDRLSGDDRGRLARPTASRRCRADRRTPRLRHRAARRR